MHVHSSVGSGASLQTCDLQIIELALSAVGVGGLHTTRSASLGIVLQVQKRQEAKQQERLEREMQEMRESIAERQMRESADAALQEQLAQRSTKKQNQ